MTPITDGRAFDLMLDFMKSNAKKQRSLTDHPYKVDERVATFTLSYLEEFGYFPHSISEWASIETADIASAVAGFQSMFGLDGTGTLTIPTVRAMESQRCGCPDVVRARHADYIRVRDTAAEQLPKWTKDGLTYMVTEYLPGLVPDLVDQQLQLAFDAWATFGNISIRQVKDGTADIVISRGKGPQSNFDGPGGTLAWACRPVGDDKQLNLKFDEDETWVMSAQERGVLLANVACHEIGHVLGLDHSRVPSALMAPYYNPNIGTPQENDDVTRFQRRYGKRQESNPLPRIALPMVITLEGEITGVNLNGKKVF